MLPMINNIRLSICINIIIVFVLFSNLVPSCVANIRSTRIRSGSHHPSTFIIDQFDFETKDAVGHVQLNLSHISIFNPNQLKLNLSQIGFTLFPPMLLADDYTYMGINIPEVTSMFCSEKLLYTLDKLNLSEPNNDHFVVELISTSDLSSIKNLYLINCLPSQIKISIDIQSAMYNLHEGHKNYLSAGKNRLLAFDFLCMGLYFLFTVAWIWILKTKTVFGIHYIMLLVLVSKLWSFPLEIINFYHVMHTGYPLAFVLLLRYLFDGIPLFILLVLLAGTEEDFLFFKQNHPKHFVLAILIPIQLLANIVKVYQAITFPCGDGCSMLMIAYFLFQPLCFLALLYPIAYTTKRLLQVGQVEGRATLCLIKVKFLNYVCKVILLHALFQSIVYLFRWSPLPFTWKVVLIGELEIFALYMFLGYSLFPQPQVHDQMSVINYDEEIAAAESLKVLNSHLCDTYSGLI